MKKLMVAVLSVLTLSSGAFAQKINLSAGLECGGYKLDSTGADSSRYSLQLSSANATGARSGALMRIYSDGATYINYADSACKIAGEKLLCSVGPVSVLISPGSNSTSENSMVPAEFHFSMPILSANKVGSCRNYDGAYHLKAARELREAGRI